MKRLLSCAALLLAVSSAACGGAARGADPAVPTVVKPDPSTPVPPDAQAKFDAAIAAFTQHEQASDWSDASCKSVVAAFDEAAAAKKGPFVQATFDAGLVLQRCGDDAGARARFEQAAKQDPGFLPAQAKVALYRYKQDGSADAAIDAIQRVVREGKFQDVSALVDLAALQMTRDAATSGGDCKDDMECAKQNLQRALAIDDSHMPALNLLALHHFQVARKRAGISVPAGRGIHARQVLTNAAKSRRADVQQLELAALVCSQAIRKNPRYAPVHNTAGLIQNELGQVNSAVEEFATAARLDPRFFEAQMNYASVNLSFRGFQPAEAAFRKALEIRPNDYDAHLGLALAMRGPLTGAEADYDKRVAAVRAELDAAKKIDAARPDAYYNEGILTQEFDAKAASAPAGTLAALDRAQASFEQFIEKAKGKTEYDGAVARAKQRLEDIDQTRTFVGGPKKP
jgi:tetratricopeptide (TPR) repeat protein